MRLADIETIRIDGIDHTLKILPTELCADMGFVGKVDYANHTIKLIDYSEPYKVQTLMHELVHVLDENRLDRNLTEGETNAIGCGMAQILLDNPDLVLAIYWAAIGDQIEFEHDDDHDEDGDDADSE